MKTQRHITHKQERILYRIIESIKRAYQYEDPEGAYPMPMPWGLYDDSVSTSLELAFPNVRSDGLYEYIKKRVIETKGVLWAEAIIDECREKQLWSYEERGLRCWLWCRKCSFEESIVDPIKEHVKQKKYKSMRKDR